MEKGETVKVCFLISKELDVGSWAVEAISDNLTALRLRTAGGEVEIINVYNPRDVGPRIKVWGKLRDALGASPERTVVVGDFNCHHPAWGGQGVPSEAQAEHLRLAIQRRNMSIATQTGVPTWKRGMASSVIDLTITTDDIAEAVMICQPRDDWAIIQDHIPIDIHLDLAPVKREESRRYAFDKLEWTEVHARIKESRWEEAEDALTALHKAYTSAIAELCPKTRPGIRANPNWSP